MPIHLKPEELLQYLPRYKVVVCALCQYAVQPSAISRHLKDIHHILRSNRKPFVRYASTLELDEPENVVRTTDELLEFPIPLLPVQDGLMCRHEGCSHLCVTTKRMKTHWATSHGRVGKSTVDWSPVPLQTFFRGSSLRYFTKPLLKPPYARNLMKTKLPMATEMHNSESKIDIFIDQHVDGADVGENAELLLHYVSCTSLTLADDAETENVWQVVVPQLAQIYPFLMHIILACSALHLAQTDLGKRQHHLISAATHQDHALPLFRTALANMTAENCHAVFAFAHLITICSFATEKENEGLLLTDPKGPDAVSNWLFFLRSGCDLAETIWKDVEYGPLRSLACAWEKQVQAIDGSWKPSLKQLLEIIPSPSCESAWSDKECLVYRDAVFQLDYAFACVEHLGNEFNTWDALRVWPMTISLDYLHLLNSWHSGALIVFAYYCVILHKLEAKWYLEGRAKRLLGHILQRLDKRWHPAIKWPMVEIGYTPETVLPFLPSFMFDICLPLSNDTPPSTAEISHNS